VMRADTETAVQSDSLPAAGDPPVSAVNGKFTHNSEYFVDVTPAHTKLSKCTEYLVGSSFR